MPQTDRPVSVRRRARRSSAASPRVRPARDRPARRRPHRPPQTRAARACRRRSATAAPPPSRSTPSTCSDAGASTFIGCAIQPFPASSVRARIRSPTPSAPRLRSRTRSRGGGTPSASQRSGTAQTLPPSSTSAIRSTVTFGHAAHLVERATGSAVDQPLVGHVLQQRLQPDLVLRAEPEALGDLAFARGHVGGGDEVEDLLARRKTGFWFVHGTRDSR